MLFMYFICMKNPGNIIKWIESRKMIVRLVISLVHANAIASSTVGEVDLYLHLSQSKDTSI